MYSVHTAAESLLSEPAQLTMATATPYDVIHHVMIRDATVSHMIWMH